MVQSTHHRLSFIKCFSINKLLIFVLYLRLHHRSCLSLPVTTVCARLYAGWPLWTGCIIVCVPEQTERSGEDAGWSSGWLFSGELTDSLISFIHSFLGSFIYEVDDNITKRTMRDIQSFDFPP